MIKAHFIFLREKSPLHLRIPKTQNKDDTRMKVPSRVSDQAFKIIELKQKGNSRLDFKH